MLRNPLPLLFLILVSIFVVAQPPVTFNHETYNGVFNSLQIDLNNDGIPDFIGLGPNFGQFQVTLSNANGSYQNPVTYNTINNEPFSAIVTGDFNNDGNGDLVVVIDGSGQSSGPGYEVFLGNGRGTLKAPSAKVATPMAMEFAVASDFNHDGKLDLALGAGLGTVWLATGNGNGSFSAPSQIFDAKGSFEDMVTGDFDGDANADIVIRQDQCVQGGCTLALFALYGNGKGSFTPVTTLLPDSQNYVGRISTFDINKDGRSDLLGPGGDQTNPWVLAVYGTAKRTLSSQSIPAGVSPDTTWPNYLTYVAAADLNGDGLNDIIYAAVQQGSTVSQIGYNFGQTNGTFGSTNLYAYGNYTDGATGGALVGDYNRDRKPDVALTDASGINPVYTVDLLINTGTGNFPKCSAPTHVGNHVCKPAKGSTVASPVAFSIAARSLSPIRKIEIWIDGKKLSETYDSLADQSFVDTNLKLSSGSHHADIYSAGYDNDLRHTAFSFTVK